MVSEYQILDVKMSFEGDSKKKEWLKQVLWSLHGTLSPGVHFIKVKCHNLAFSISNFITQLLVFKTPKTGV